MHRLRFAEASHGLALAGRKKRLRRADPAADAPEDVSAEPIVEQEAPLTREEITRRTERLRKDAKERWEAFQLDDSDILDEAHFQRVPTIEERLHLYLAQPYPTEAFLHSLEAGADQRERIDRYVEMLKELSRTEWVAVADVFVCPEIMRLISVLHKEETQSNVRAVCEELIQENTEREFLWYLEYVLAQAKTHRATMDAASTHESVMLLRFALNLEDKEERAQALEDLFEVKEVARSILDEAFRRRSHPELNALKESGELAALFEKSAPLLVLGNPDLFGVTRDTHTRLMRDNHVPVQHIARSMYVSEGLSDGIATWQAWLRAMPEDAFAQVVTQEEEGQFICDTSNERPHWQSFWDEAYTAIVHRVADRFERDVTDPVEGAEQAEQARLLNVTHYEFVQQDTYPRLSIGLFLNAMLELRSRRVIVPPLYSMINEDSFLPESVVAIPGFSGGQFVARCLDDGYSHELLELLTRNYTTIMGDVPVKESALLLNRLLDAVAEAPPHEALRHIMMEAYRAGAGGKTVLKRFVDMEMANDPEVFLSADTLFEMLSSAQRREVVEHEARRDPYVLAISWWRTSWSTPEEGVELLESFRAQGIEPFTFVRDARLMDMMLRTDWYRPPFKLTQAYAGVSRDAQRHANAVNTCRRLLQASEKWLKHRPPVEQAVVLASAVHVYTDDAVGRRDDRSELRRVMRELDRRAPETQAIVRAVESTVKDDEMFDLASLIRVFAPLVAGHAPDSIWRHEAGEAFVHRARHTGPAGGPELKKMLGVWLTEQYGLSDRVVTSWMEVGRDKTAGALFAEHIGALKTLEFNEPGGARILEREFGVRAFGRYPIALLIRQVRERDDKGVPYGVLVTARGDWNGAFFNDHVYRPFGLLVHHTVRMIEVDSLTDAARRFINMEHRGYPPASFMLISGHGTPEGIQLGLAVRYDKHGMSTEGSHRFSKQHLEGKGVQRFAKRFLREGAPIIFNSCSTGEKGGISENVSRTWGLEMIAPQVPAAIADIELTETRDGVTVDRVKYATNKDDTNDSPVERRYLAGVVALRT